MLVGFDLDGCVINFHPILIEVAKEVCGVIDISKDDWGLGLNSPEKEKEIVDIALLKWTEYKPYPGAIEFIEEYYKRTWSHIYFITSRPNNTEQVTRNWIESYLDPHVIYKLFHTEDKVKVIKGKNITHFIEDKPETVDKLIETGIEVFMPIREWNKNYQNEKVTRFSEWKELSFLLPEIRKGAWM